MFDVEHIMEAFDGFKADIRAYFSDREGISDPEDSKALEMLSTIVAMAVSEHITQEIDMSRTLEDAFDAAVMGTQTTIILHMNLMESIISSHSAACYLVGTMSDKEWDIMKEMYTKYRPVLDPIVKTIRPKM